MNETQIIILAATALAGIGLWLMLPRGDHGGRRLGVVLGLASLGLFASRLPRLGILPAAWTNEAVFWILAGVTIVSAVGAVTMRNPVYCAIWFAMTLLGTSGLFLFQGAQFLGVATIVVYAGAILVTFLFVLMLAQPRGHAYYDRVTWEGLLSASVGAVMIGVLTMVIIDAFTEREIGDGLTAQVDPTAPAPLPIVDPSTADERSEEILSNHHMDHLGAQLFSRHLIAVEVAGTMLLVALVGAVAIAIQGKQMPKTAGGARHG